MPKIPVYEQGALASPAVGTPGVDTSEATALSALATASEGVAGQLATAAYYNNAAEAQKKLQVAKAQKALDDVSIASGIAMDKSAVGVELNTISKQIQTESQFNTNGIEERYQKASKGVLEKYAANYSDPASKLKFRQAFDEVNATEAKSLDDFKYSRVDDINKSNLGAIAGDLAHRMGRANLQSKEAGELIAEHVKNLPLYQAAHGAKGEEVMRTDIEVAVKQSIAAYALTGPSAADFKKYINSPLVKQYVDPTTALPFMNQQRTLAAQEASANAAEALVGKNTVSTLRFSNAMRVLTNVDATDKASISAGLAQTKSMLAEQLSLPVEEQDKETMSMLNRNIDKLGSQLENFGQAEFSRKAEEKKQAEQPLKDAGDARFNSKEALSARVRVDGLAKSIATRYKEGKYQDANAYLADLKATLRSVDEAYVKGYLDKPLTGDKNYETKHSFLESRINALEDARNKRRAKEGATLQSTWDAIWGKEDEFSRNIRQAKEDLRVLPKQEAVKVTPGKKADPSSKRIPLTHQAELEIDSATRNFSIGMHAAVADFRKRHDGKDPPQHVIDRYADLLHQKIPGSNAKRK